MKRTWQMLTCSLALVALLLAAFGSNKAVDAFSQKKPVADSVCVIIDAGHGGVDGGATSCTGVLESNINLQIALRLNDLMNLLGIRTKMIRTTDCSVYTKGETIAAKKASDLKERVRLVEETKDSYLISIHQNYFSDSKYYGAQVFFTEAKGSRELAAILQSAFVASLNPGSNRGIKRGDGIYLLEHITKPGVLVECGFLSNPAEETKLRDAAYQKKICCVIASGFSVFVGTQWDT